MSVLDRKLLREVRGSRWLLLAIISIVGVGVMMFVYMRSAYFNLSRARDQYYVQGRMADFWIDVKKVPVSDLKAVAELPGVSEIRSRIQFMATVDLEDVAEPLNGLVLSLPDRQQPVINDIVLRQGGYFSDRRAEEVIVNDTFARKHHIHPGDWINLVLNNRRQELYVVGTAISCEYVYLVSAGVFVPDPEHFGVFYLKHSYAEEVFDMSGAASQIVGILAPEVREHPQALLDQAERVLEPYGVLNKFARRDQPSNRFLSDEIHGIGTFATILPIMFLAVAALVLNVFISRLVEQQRTVIGTLKAIGYGDRALLTHYLKYGLAVGLCGGLAGWLGGYLMANWVTSMYKNFFEFPDLNNIVYPGTYIAALGISLLCALIGSLRGARLAIRLQPAEAMRARPPGVAGAVFLERIGWFWRRLSFGWRMVLRLVIRNRLRTAVGIFAAAMGAGLLVCAFMLSSAMQFLMHFQYDLVNRADVDLSLRDDHSGLALAEARQLPAVDAAEPLLAVGGTFWHGPYQRKGAITGLSQNAKLTIPRDTAGDPLSVPPLGLMISHKLADLLHAQVGDTITFRPSRGLQQWLEVPVTKIADEYIGLSTYADIDYLSHLLGEEFAVSGVQLKTNPKPTEQAALNAELKRLPAVQAVNRREDVIHNLKANYIDVQKIFITILVLFAGVIFFGSILNAALIGLAERRREAATLLVLGYSRWQVGGLFLRESMLVTLCGTLCGLPLGYLLTWSISLAYDTEMFRFPLVLSAGTLANTVGLAVLFGLLAHLGVQRSIHKLDWLDALNVKE
ncbi:MAG: ABC transporter permease [Planctomycetia bacterium]|nr:ABC transporter permease [Planctomycetia bacterium]